MKRISLYGIVTVVSTIVRQFYLPNPFECFGDKATLINWIAEPIIHMFAYVIVGMFYTRGSAPAVGSLLYLFTYALIVGLLWVMGIFSFAWWWVLIILIIIGALCYGVYWLKERIG